jgi:hypothetical protein
MLRRGLPTGNFSFSDKNIFHVRATFHFHPILLNFNALIITYLREWVQIMKPLVTQYVLLPTRTQYWNTV